MWGGGISFQHFQIIYRLKLPNKPAAVLSHFLDERECVRLLHDSVLLQDERGGEGTVIRVLDKHPHFYNEFG